MLLRIWKNLIYVQNYRNMTIFGVNSNSCCWLEHGTHLARTWTYSTNFFITTENTQLKDIKLFLSSVLSMDTDHVLYYDLNTYILLFSILLN